MHTRLLLYDIRVTSGMTQSELARKSGVKQGIISDIESGKTVAPRLDTAAKLAAALNCTVDDLLNDTVPTYDPEHKPAG